MRKIQTLAATAAIAVATFAIGTQLQAQPYYGGGYGMMGGGYGPGYGMMGGGYGPGYMMGGGYGGGYGPGYMMGGGYGPGYGMMNGGYGPGYMMNGGYGCGGYQCQGPNQGYGPRQGYGPGYGMMGGYGPGYNRGQGNLNQGNLNLSVDDVTKYLAQMIRNPNLKVGDVKEKDADTITAEIVTKDKGGIVQTLQFNRHNGAYQPVEAQ
ncbi:MAG: hypothetical protein GC182_08260 [Rhodopseudomonas sp.]|nr:hypothetical protein [Rhodopseudomonas sp.]